MLDWQPLYPVAVYAFLGLGIVALLITAHRVAITAANRRRLLLGIRATVLVALLVLLLNPTDRQEAQLPPRPPSVAMLVDCSQSMSLGGDESRIDRVKRMIGSVTREVHSEQPYRIDLYRFGRQLAGVPGISELTANEDASLL